MTEEERRIPKSVMKPEFIRSTEPGQTLCGLHYPPSPEWLRNLDGSEPLKKAQWVPADKDNNPVED